MERELLYNRYDASKMKVKAVRTLICRYFISYWNNRKICSTNLSVQEQVLMELYHPEELQGDTPDETEQEPSADLAGQESAAPSEDENTGES